MKFASQLVNFDACPGDPYRPVVTPIYQTATFQQQEADRFGEYDYSRSGNPTRSVLEHHLAVLEHGTRAFCFSSGMAAISTVAALLQPGDQIVADGDLYGGTCRLFSRILTNQGITVRYVDMSDLEQVTAALSAKTRLVYAESPTNPLLRVIDLPSVAKLAHAHGALFCVDNSLMSPYLQNPLALGADLVVHSATKFLCGHSDVTGGVIVVKDEELAERVYFLQNAQGNALGPFDCYLLMRGLKTLKLRLDAQQTNARAIAEFLCQHPRVREVYYPGISDSPASAIHHQQARGTGAVLAFTTGSKETSKHIVERLRMFRIAVSFGSVNSTISIPGFMSHASVPAEIRATRQLPEDLVRVSAGIEDADDLIADLDRALSQALLQHA